MITVNEKKINFYDGMTVADAVLEANEEIGDLTIIIVNKKVVYPNQLNEIISDGISIKVMKILSGG